MPLSKKGNKIVRSMRKTYGPVKSKQVFYAMKNKGAITGVDKGFFGHFNPNALRKNSIHSTGR